jgi:hypothetical protein
MGAPIGSLDARAGGLGTGSTADTVGPVATVKHVIDRNTVRTAARHQRWTP